MAKFSCKDRNNKNYEIQFDKKITVKDLLEQLTTQMKSNNGLYSKTEDRNLELGLVIVDNHLKQNHRMKPTETIDETILHNVKVGFFSPGASVHATPQNTSPNKQVAAATPKNASLFSPKEKRKRDEPTYHNQCQLTVELIINGTSENHTIYITNHETTVQEIKNQLLQELEGNNQITDIKLIHNGRFLQSQDVIKIGNNDNLKIAAIASTKKAEPGTGPTPH